MESRPQETGVTCRALFARAPPPYRHSEINPRFSSLPIVVRLAFGVPAPLSFRVDCEASATQEAAAFVQQPALAAQRHGGASELGAVQVRRRPRVNLI